MASALTLFTLGALATDKSDSGSDASGNKQAVSIYKQTKSIADMPYEIEPVEAPFEVPQFVRPTFPDRSLSIAKTGAKQNKLSTKAIQKAIDRIHAKGGGTVVVPKGKWLSGRIRLKSNVCLHLEEGAELHFSGDIKDYLPAVHARNEGVDVLSLGAMIYAYEADNIALTGKGRLVGPDYECEVRKRGEGGIADEVGERPFEKRVFDGQDGGRIFTPVFFGPMFSTNVFVEGVTFDKSIFWNIVPVYCKGIIIRGVTVNSHGHGRTDGIDIDSSEDALIEYTSLDCGDDCFTLKSGRGIDGVKRARPTANVIIRHCLVKRGVGGITVGSETAAMVRNVYAHDVVMEAPRFPFYMKTRRPRGGGGENIVIERVHVKDCVGPVINFDMLGSATYVGKLAERHPDDLTGSLAPVFRNVVFRDLTVDKTTKMLLRAKGLPEAPIEGVVLERVKSPNMEMKLQDVGTIEVK